MSLNYPQTLNSRRIQGSYEGKKAIDQILFSLLLWIFFKINHREIIGFQPAAGNIYVYV